MMDRIASDMQELSSDKLEIFGAAFGPVLLVLLGVAFGPALFVLRGVPSARLRGLCYSAWPSARLRSVTRRAFGPPAEPRCQIP
jgi:hypothetical protein